MTRLFAGTQWDRPPRCERCGQDEAVCNCPPPAPEYPPPSSLTAKISVEKRRNGKTATVIRGLSAAHTDLNELLGALKQTCGAGGTIKDDQLEIQGDHRGKIDAFLRGRSYRTKNSS